MNSYKLENIPPGSFFSGPVYLDNEFVLASPEAPITAGMLHALDEWEFREILSAGEVRGNYAGDGTADSAAQEGLDFENQDRFRRVEEFYRDLQGYMDRLFMQTAIGIALELSEMTEKVKGLCAMIREDRRFLLLIQKPLPAEEEGDFLPAHSVRSTIIALIIGLYMKLPSHRLIELGIAALVHEIGMVKIPRWIYSAQRALSPGERMNILTHPVASYNILKANNFPPPVNEAALQHHERENGSGYPQMLTGERIGLYGKIIAVACSYEALTADRPHKDAKDSHSGMMDLLKNEGKIYDDTIIRALVYSLSIYPIGLHVLLSSGEKGQVVDVNSENPRFPIVSLLGKNKIAETSAETLWIIRPLSRPEIEDL